MSKKYSYIVFDLDGTLMDTYPGVAVSFTKAEQELGLRHLSDKELRTVIGPALEDSFYRLYGLEGEEQLDKRSDLVIAMKEWVDSQYEDGRQTAMTDRELEEKIDELAPGQYHRI